MEIQPAVVEKVVVGTKALEVVKELEVAIGGGDDDGGDVGGGSQENCESGRGDGNCD